MRENFNSPTEETRNNFSNVVATGLVPPFRGASGVKTLTKKVLARLSPDKSGGQRGGRNCL